MDLWADLCRDLSTSDNDKVVHFCFFCFVFFPFRKYFLQRTGLWCCQHTLTSLVEQLLWGAKDNPRARLCLSPALLWRGTECAAALPLCLQGCAPTQAGESSLSSSSLSSQLGHFSKCDFKSRCSGGGSSFSCGVLQRVISDWAVTMEHFMLGKLHTIEINLKPVNPLCRGHNKKLASHHSSQHSLTSLRFCSVTYKWKAPWAIWASAIHLFSQLAVFK